MLDQRKSTIIAKVAAQIVDYYENQLAKNLETEIVAKTLGSKKVKAGEGYFLSSVPKTEGS